MKKLHTFMTAAMIGGSLSLVSGCENENTALPLSLKSEALPLSGEHGVQLSESNWLHYGPESGIKLSLKSGDVLDSASLNTEYMAQGHDKQGAFVLAIDQTGKPTLIRAGKADSLTIKQGEKVETPLEGMCLYQPKGGNTQAFLMDETGMAHQVLIKENASSITFDALRSFPLPPGAEYCSVHNDTDQLFVSEESVGVWRYSARAESEVSRSVVELVAPYGELEENAGPLSIVGDTLVIAEVGTANLHTKLITEDKTLDGERYQLPGNVKIENLSVSFLDQPYEKNLIALDDETSGLVSFNLPISQVTAATSSITNIPAVGETEPVASRGDAADDPAIWVNPNQAENSRILGTNKKRGLYVYDLSGAQLQELLVDRVNNVDVRQGFTLKGQAADIAAASQRDRSAIALFHIHPDTGLVTTANEISTGLSDVYGMCMYQGKEDRMYVYINDEDGRYEQWEITDSSQGWDGTLVRSFAVSSQPEGCTTDEKQHRLFVGEENKALFTLGAEPTDSTDMDIIAETGGMLKADIEGMEVYQTDNKSILVVSSQGNDSYVLFEANAPYTYLGRFRVDLNAQLGIDGASETDGLSVTSANLGPDYPKGMLVVQDGRNLLPMETQNFKLVSWETIEQALNL